MLGKQNTRTADAGLTCDHITLLHLLINWKESETFKPQVIIYIITINLFFLKERTEVYLTDRCGYDRRGCFSLPAIAELLFSDDSDHKKKKNHYGNQALV